MGTLSGRFALKYQALEHRRVISGAQVIIHCHHYNSRIQDTIESAKGIDGKQIVVDSAEAACLAPIQESLQEGDDEAVKWTAAVELYAHLGFGHFDIGALASDDVITATSSHYVEGWATGFKQHDGPVCSFTEGYLQAAVRAVTGELVTVKEVACMNSGADQCRFEVDRSRTTAFVENAKKSFEFTPKDSGYDTSLSNIDENAIIDALVGMPIYGNEQGLIPAFGVYLANTPADYYNLVNIRFLKEMTAIGKFSAAKELLINAGETCAMNTFRGIMESPEWAGLVAPMLKDEQDSLFALVSLSNGFGWGNWYVTEHEAEESLCIESINGYEAYGGMEYGDPCEHGQCFMLAGVAAGMMELIYSEGSIADRFGTFDSEEQSCISNRGGCCSFAVEAV